MKLDSAKRIISGTWGEVWLDGELVGECYGMQAKFSYDKEKVVMPGQMSKDTKLLSREGTGTLKMHKVNSRMNLIIGNMVAQGHDPRFTIISKLKDPDAYGFERVAVYNVSFDDEVIADWESGQAGKIEAPFTFTDREFLDAIPA